MRMTTFIAIATGLAASLATVSALGAAPVIHNLGIFPGGTYSTAAGVSGNGVFVTGTADVVTTQSNNYAFRYSVSGGLVNLGTPLGGQNSKGEAINQDGMAIAGTSDFKVFRWTQQLGMQDLGLASVASSFNFASGISSNGATIVGSCIYTDGYSRGFRWNANNNFVMLHGGSNNVGVFSTTVRGVAGDGGRTVGNYPGLQYGPWASMWDAQGNLASVSPPHPWGSTATAISRNSKVIVGVTYSNEFFRYVMTPPVTMTVYNNFIGSVNATNFDGKVVVGSAAGAAYWSTTLGLHNLNTLLPQLGTNLPGWVLQAATGVSDDGSVIVGVGTYNGATRGFMVTGVVCPSVPVMWNNPTARSICPVPGSGTTVSLEIEAPGEVTYQWSVESPPDSGEFETITGPFFADASGQRFRVSGWDGPELTIADLQPAAGRPSITILPHVANPCGPAIAVPFQVVLCRADLDCNEQVDDADFVEFAAGYNDLLCPSGTPGLPPYCPGDLNSDGVVDDSDFVEFVTAYNALVCV